MTEADLRHEFTRQNVWRRIAIVAAGPLANFLLAIVVYAGLSMYGAVEPSTKLRAPAETSAAYAAGLRGGEHIVAVNGKAVASWDELRWQLVDAIVDRHEARLDVRQPQGGQFAAVVPSRAFEGLDVEGDVMTRLGFAPGLPKAVIEQVIAGGPGAKAGLQPRDLVTAIDGKPMIDGLALVETVRASNGRALALEGLRDGAPFALTVAPEFDAARKLWAIKVMTSMAPEMVTVSYGPVEAFGKAAVKTWDTSILTIRMIGKMITGEVSLKNVTGPITIADYAGRTALMGAQVFLSFVAFISISLGVMNLLPIPVLDGGHLLYYSLEVLTGRPLPERIGAFAQRAGIGLLVLLMALAVFNDVARLL